METSATVWANRAPSRLPPERRPARAGVWHFWAIDPRRGVRSTCTGRLLAGGHLMFEQWARALSDRYCWGRASLFGGSFGPVSLGIVKVRAVTRASGSQPGGGTRFCIADVCIRKPGTPALPSAGLGPRAENASEGAHRAHLPGCGLGCPGPRSHGTRTGTGHCATACPLRRPKASEQAGHIHRLQPAERLDPQRDQRLRGSAHRRLPLRSATSPSNGGSAPDAQVRRGT
jgi:hypothetical protein